MTLRSSYRNRWKWRQYKYWNDNLKLWTRCSIFHTCGRNPGIITRNSGQGVLFPHFSQFVVGSFKKRWTGYGKCLLTKMPSQLVGLSWDHFYKPWFLNKFSSPPQGENPLSSLRPVGEISRRYTNTVALARMQLCVNEHYFSVCMRVWAAFFLICNVVRQRPIRPTICDLKLPRYFQRTQSV